MGMDLPTDMHSLLYPSPCWDANIFMVFLISDLDQLSPAFKLWVKVKPTESLFQCSELIFMWSGILHNQKHSLGN
jgi:hypothetical protein